MSDGDETLIEFDDAGKSFDDTWIVRHLDLSVRRGTVLGLIGPSGSGKTSTVRLMNGAYQPDEGSVRVLGSDPATRDRRGRRAIGYLPQQPILFDELSLWENLNFHASLNGVGLRRKRRLLDMLELVDLDSQERKLVRESSGGMRRRLALAATMAHDPTLLMLDEPTAGIDPILRRRFWDHFHQLRDSGRTLVISTQFVDEASYCDLVGLLADGLLVALDTPENLQRHAFGGDLVDIEAVDRLAGADMDRLREGVGVVDVTRRSETAARITLEPGTSIRDVVSGRLPDVELASTSVVATDWNDVFVQLLGRTAADGAAGADTSPKAVAS